MALTPITTDVETFWDDDMTLTRGKMTPLEYCFDPRFEFQSAATKIGAGETVVTFGFDETKALYDDIGRTIGWGKVCLVGHNMSGFDSIILASRFGLNPRLWACTLAMARPLHGRDPQVKLPDGHFTGPCTLAGLAQTYGLRAKGSLEATNTKGKRLADFSPTEIEAMREYNKRDTDITYDLFRILREKTSTDELLMIDRTVRMLVEPRFVLDVKVLDDALLAERARKQELLRHLSSILGLGDDVEAMRKTCRSAPKFSALLENLGIEVPMKEGKNGPIPALAKTDPAMAELLESEDDLVRTAAEVRAQVQTSYFEGRAKRLLQTQVWYKGKVPVPLRHCGALQTARLSGDMKLNLQNLARIIPGTPKATDALRKSLCAPPGHVVVVADLSGIEMRVNHFFWGVEDSMARWKADRKADLYRPFAGDHLYGIPHEAVTKMQRTAGKVAQLQLGYRSGWKKLASAARIQTSGELLLDDEEAKRIVNVWRRVYWKIRDGWDLLDQALRAIHDGHTTAIDPWGLCAATPQGIKTPKWLITYPQLHQRKVGGWKQYEWYFRSEKGPKALHGGVCCENISQHLAGQVLKDAWASYERDPISRVAPVVHQVHDELVLMAPENHAQEALAILQDKLRTPPAWWPELVTYSEGGIANNYGDVEK